MSGYSKEELEEVISIVAKKLADARERVDEREIALHQSALKQLKAQLGDMLTSEELANREQASQEDSIRKQMRQEESRMQQTTRAMKTMGKRRGRQAWRWTKKNAKPMAAGAAAGIATGAAYAHQKAQQGLQKAASGAGYLSDKANETYIRHQEKIQGTFWFVIIAVAVIGFEFFSAANGNWAARIGFYGTLVAALWGISRSIPFAERAGMAALVVNVGWWIYLTGADVPFFQDILSGDVGLTIATLVLLPGLVWYLLFFEPEFEVSGLIKNPVGIIVFVALFFTVVFPQLTMAGGLIPTPPGGFDTGEAAQDAFRFTLASFGEGFGEFGCWLGFDQTCGFAGWLNDKIAPFAYDATTVHKLQNRDLGVYITDVDERKTFSINPNSDFDYLPSGVNFKIKAPIPQDLEFEFCGVQNSELKGFPGLCNNTIILSCDADVGSTKIEPRDSLSVSQAVSSQGTLFTCKISPPTEDIRSTEVTIKAQYPFVTNTYKLLRAVDGTQSLSNDQVRELENFQDDFIVSTGGPVIVETDESNFFSVSENGQSEQLILTLKAQPDVRLEAVDSIQIYVPDGARLVSRPESLCAVEPVRIDNSSEVDCTGFQDECEYVQAYTPSHVQKDSIPACRAYDECVEGDYTTRSGSIYLITSTEDISMALGNTRGTGNEVQIACELNIEDKNEFLYRNQLVTERALNIIAKYDVTNQQTSRITFDGTPPRFPIGTFSGTSEVCRVSDPSLSIPTGILPLTKSPSITQTFGASDTSKDGHRGVDLDLEIGDDVIAAWSGKVMLICGEEFPRCEDRWHSFGNMVVIRTKTQSGASFDHIYAHLDSISVSKNNDLSQGQKIGEGGNTGKVISYGGGDGSHLHFELRTNYIEKFSNFDPLPHLYSDELVKDPKYQEARRRVSCQPVVSYSDRDAQEARNNAIAAISNPTPEQIQNVDRIIGAAKKFGVPVEVALAVGWQENAGFKHIEGGEVKLSSSGDIGLMQINHRRDPESDTGITYCGDMTRSTGHEPLGVVTEDIEYTRLLMKPDFNALCGMEILRDKYDDNSRLYRTHGLICGVERTGCTEGSACANLTGWKAAAKAYNGWTCTGDALYYPNSVERHITETLNLRIPSGWT